MSKKYFFLIAVSILLIAACFVIISCKQQVQELEQVPFNQNEESSGKQFSQSDFFGENGDVVFLVEGKVDLSLSLFSDDLAHYYNTEFPNGKRIYFFIIKDKNGIYRAAANACQVCYGARMGFRQQGSFMVCNTCGNRYPLEKIATEKGGCNPGPINPNLEIRDDKAIIIQSDLEQVAELF